MVEPLWRGVAVALVTLFDPDGKVDVTATAEHAARLAAEGVAAVLAAGSTGEADALTDDERLALISAVRGALPSGVPVLAGASGAWTGATAGRVAGAVSAGADAVLVAPPRRGGDLVAFFREVDRAAGTAPVLAYHFPGVAGGEVPVAALPQLPVAGIKDSTGDAERLLAELAGWDRWTFVGSTVLALLAGALGATGAILAVANAYPDDCLAAFAGDAAAQRRLLEPHVTARARFPHGLKAMVAQRYGTSPVARLG